MAASKYPTTQYTSDQFVESCGAVLFDLSPQTQTPKLNQLNQKHKQLQKKRRQTQEKSASSTTPQTQPTNGSSPRAAATAANPEPTRPSGN